MKTIATWICEEDDAFFAARFAPHPHIVLRNARLEPVEISECDALMLTGGCDVGPTFLRQEINDRSLIHDDEPGRDEWEFPALAKARTLNLPVFTICRGTQVLNVALGGTLHLDIDGHREPVQENTQTIRYEIGAGPQFPGVNSEHHQALDQLGAGLVIEARSPGDEIVEQVRLPGARYCFGVQFHPERDALYQPLFDNFVAAIG